MCCHVIELESRVSRPAIFFSSSSLPSRYITSSATNLPHQLSHLCLYCLNLSNCLDRALRGTMSGEVRAESSIMALKKKDKVSIINRLKKKRRRPSSRKRSLEKVQKVKRETLKWIQDEMAEVRAETNSVKECQETILTELDHLRSDIAHTREVNKHVIRHNTRTHQLLDLMLARIITGSGTVP